MSKLRKLDDAEAAALRALAGRRVAAARRELGLTMEQLGKAFGRSRPWVSGIEKGKWWAPHYLILPLARAIEADPSWFYGAGEGDKV